jgi:peptidoglycan hydrolase CwlO-like protein
MKYALGILSLVVVAALTSVSAQAACGGGGYKPTVGALKANDKAVSYETVSVEHRSSRLDGVQRDLDKAQAKLDSCQGDCDKEKRKLQEAKAKFDKKAAQV